MQKTRKIVTIIIAIMVAFVINGVSSTASYAATNYDVWINGERFSSDKTVIQCGDGTATYDADTKTLTLENATITEFGKVIVSENTFKPCYIGASDDLSIVLVGNNVAELSDPSDYGNGSGISINGDHELSISGSGSLSMDYVMRGICVGDDKTRSGKLNIDSTNISIKTVYYYGEGMDINGPITISNSTVDIDSDYVGINQNSQETMLIENSNVNIKSRTDGIYLADRHTVRDEETGIKMVDSNVVIESSAGYGIAFRRYGGNTVIGSITMEGGVLEMYTKEGGSNQDDPSYINLNGAVYKEGFNLQSQDVKLEASRITIDMAGHGENIVFYTDKSSTLTKEQLLSKIEDVAAEDNGYIFMGLAPKAQSSYTDFSSYEKDTTADKDNGWSISTAENQTVYSIWFKKISDVSVSIIPPTDGEKAQTPTVTTSTKEVSISGRWTKSSKVTDASTFSGTFEGGNTYHANVDLDNKWGYAFPTDGNVTVKVNGGTFKEKLVTQNDADSDLNVTIDVVAYTSKKQEKETAKDENTNKKEDALVKGEDGTALGKGASSALAEKTILDLKNDSDPKGSVYNVLQLKVKKAAKIKLTLTCTNAKKQGAVKYILYGNKCGKKNKYVKLAASKKTTFSVSKIVKTKLKKGTYYKFIAVAVDKNDKVVSTSKTIHVATTGGKVGNVKKITTKAKKNKVSIKAKKKFKLGAKQVAASKKLKVNKHRGIKYESTNKKIATVNSKGVITGKKKGSCYVYAYAQNGVCAKIKVIVK